MFARRMRIAPCKRAKDRTKAVPRIADSFVCSQASISGVTKEAPLAPFITRK